MSGQQDVTATQDSADARPLILHIISGLGTGGAEMMLWRLVTRAKAVQHAVISLRGRGPVGQRMLACGVDVDSIGLPRPMSMLLALPRLAVLTRRRRPAIVQGWMTHGNFAATFASAIARAPLLWNVRQSLVNMDYEKFTTSAVLRATAAVSGRAQGIIYNSVAGADQHEAIGYPKARRIIIPNGFDTTRLRPDASVRDATRRSLGVADDETLVGLIGRFHPMKNHSGFLEVMRRLAAELPRLRILLAGTGTDGLEIRKMAAQAGLTSRLLALGDRSDIPQLMCSLDIAVNMSVHGEGFPNVVGEAMASGVPNVVSDVGDSAWVVGDTGLTVAPDDLDAAFEAIRALALLAPQERQQLGLRARQRVCSEFAIETIVDRYEQAYLAMLDDRRAFCRGEEACVE